jgi:hypothetical protein
VERYTEIINSPIQGAEADGFKIAVAQLYEHRHDVPDARLLMCVHDELVVEAPIEQVEETSAWLTKHMRAAMDEVVQGQVPIDVDAGWERLGRNTLDYLKHALRSMRRSFARRSVMRRKSRTTGRCVSPVPMYGTRTINRMRRLVWSTRRRFRNQSTDKGRVA